MKDISREYLKIYRSVIIQLWAITAVCAGAFAISGAFKSENPIFAIAVCGVFAGFSLATTAGILLSPKAFELKLKKCPKEVRDEILGGKFSALGARRFYEHYLLYYSKRKINFISFDEIKRVNICSILKTELTISGGKKIFIPTSPDEDAAVIAAAFKSKNPQIEFVINGRTIEKTDGKGRKK